MLQFVHSVSNKMVSSVGDLAWFLSTPGQTNILRALGAVLRYYNFNLKFIVLV